ncbi:hypothetical protein BH11ARM1_BH11ARM1_11390 [soil metagenome]
MVYGGKIYETEGGDAVAVHEAEAVRPLSPVPNAPTIRIYRSDLQPGIIAGIDAEDPLYFFANPTNLLGASQILNFPDGVGEVTIETYLVVVAVSDAFQIEVEIAEEIILGYTLMSLIVSHSIEGIETRTGAVGRSHDLGGVIGPVLTTPEEIEEQLVSMEGGKRYDLPAVLRVNGVERARGNADSLPFSAAEAISAASRFVPVRSGDIFAFGPLTTSDEPILLGPGDEIQLAGDLLGTLALKLS